MKRSLKSLINSNMGKKVISLILGLGLATIFRKSCKGNCIIYKGGNELKNKKIFKYNNKCYNYKPTSTKCYNDKKIVNL